MNDILKALLAQRDALEIEAEAIANELKSPGLNGELPAGISGPLVDADGYPRGDIDILNIRQKRARLSTVNYDHKQLMKRIETEIQYAHAVLGSVNSSSISSTLPIESSTSSMLVDNLQPIAKIDDILDGSPAKEAGLIDGDILVKFGPVDGKTPGALNEIPNVVRNNVNNSILIVVRRVDQPTPMTFTLVPKLWSGRGLLGCHLSHI